MIHSLNGPDINGMADIFIDAQDIKTQEQRICLVSSLYA
jgi:hypothetical protein